MVEERRCGTLRRQSEQDYPTRIDLSSHGCTNREAMSTDYSITDERIGK
jgi:hypothetical protein